jgi:hypothetical protein
MLLNIRQLMDDAKCYEVVRELRWPNGRWGSRLQRIHKLLDDTK